MEKRQQTRTSQTAAFSIGFGQMATRPKATYVEGNCTRFGEAPGTLQLHMDCP